MLRLKTGWSSRSSNNQIVNNSTVNHSPLISEAEYNEIESVIKRASQIEKKELSRIGKLIERYKTLNKPLGDGNTHCLICNCNFGILAAGNSRICNHCLKVNYTQPTS